MHACRWSAPRPRSGATAGTMRSYLLPGSPYVTAVYSGLAPAIVLSQAAKDHAITSVVYGSKLTASLSGRRLVTLYGQRFVLQLACGIWWKVYFSARVSVTVTAGSLNATSVVPSGIVVRMAMLYRKGAPGPLGAPGNGYEAVLDAYADAYPVGASVSFGSVPESEEDGTPELGVLRLSYTGKSMAAAQGTLTSSARMLVLAPPHQMRHVQYSMLQPKTPLLVNAVPHGDLLGFVLKPLAAGRAPGSDYSTGMHLVFELPAASFHEGCAPRAARGWPGRERQRQRGAGAA